MRKWRKRKKKITTTQRQQQRRWRRPSDSIKPSGCACLVFLYLNLVCLCFYLHLSFQITLLLLLLLFLLHFFFLLLFFRFSLSTINTMDPDWMSNRFQRNKWLSCIWAQHIQKQTETWVRMYVLVCVCAWVCCCFFSLSLLNITRLTIVFRTFHFVFRPKYTSAFQHVRLYIHLYKCEHKC